MSTSRSKWVWRDSAPTFSSPEGAFWLRFEFWRWGSGLTFLSYGLDIVYFGSQGSMFGGYSARACVPEGTA